MKTLLAVLLLALTPVAFAATDDAASPDVKQESKAGKPATRPADGDFPSPAELIRKMKEIEKKKASLTKVAYFNLGRPVAEKQADFSIFGDDGSLTLRSLLDRLHVA